MGPVIQKPGPALIGRIGEVAGAEYLKSAGYRVIGRNIRTPSGEIDLVAIEGDTLSFVEVKTCASDENGLPLEQIGPLKQRRIREAALWYLRDSPSRCPVVRFDALGITFMEGRPARYELVRDAF